MICKVCRTPFVSASQTRKRCDGCQIMTNRYYNLRNRLRHKGLTDEQWKDYCILAHVLKKDPHL